MRAITIRNPWAWAVVYAGKTCENRSRNIAGTYRGPIAIHAGLTEDTEAYDDDLIRDALSMFDDSWLLQQQMEPGAFIGIGELVDVHEEWETEYEYGPVGCCSSPWSRRGFWHLMFARIRPLPHPIPCRGRLGLWTPPEPITTQLLAA